jgi:hypothetical protein
MIQEPKGIDLPIQEMQQLFIANLWPDTDASKKEFNHRVFGNLDKEDNLYPETFIDNTKDYKRVKFNDNLYSLSWFDVSDTTDSYQLGQIEQSVGVFFAVNLAKLYPALTHRAVEESHLAVQRILLKRSGEFEITGITTGAAAYGDFDITNLKDYNMQPWHVFRFDCNVKYSLNC